MRSDGQSELLVHVELQVGPQVQLSKAVHPGRRHLPEAQIKSDGHWSFVEQSVLHAGPGVGLGVGVGQTQLSESVQDGLRHVPAEQVMVVGQSLSDKHVLLHCGTGVGVGVGLGVGVGDAVGVGVGLSDGGGVPAIVKESVQLVAAGCDSGAVGASGCCTEVRRVITTTAIAAINNATTAIPAIMYFRFFIVTNSAKAYRLVQRMDGTVLYILQVDQR